VDWWTSKLDCAVIISHQRWLLVAGCCLLFSDRPLFSIHTGSVAPGWPDLVVPPLSIPRLTPLDFLPWTPPTHFTPYTLPFRCWLLAAGPGPRASLMSLAVQCLRPVPSPTARTLEPLPGDAHSIP
jgi:hypothetical protein